MKQDTAITWNWFRVNLPTITAIFGLGIYLNTHMITMQKSIEEMDQYRTNRAAHSDRNFAEINSKLTVMSNIPYRVEMAEGNINKTNERLDNLSNTIINQMDLIRRDVNRLTTQVEVLSSRVGVLTGDIDEPRRRISRPPQQTEN